MREVLLVYREVALQNEVASKGSVQPHVITVSVDEEVRGTGYRKHRSGLAARARSIPHFRS